MSRAARNTGRSTIDDQAVIDHLLASPDFFERNASALLKLRLQDGRGGTVSLLERQVEVLRDRNRQLEARIAEFIDIGRTNDLLAARIHTLTTRLIHARGLDKVVDALESSLREDFDVPSPVLVLFRDDPSLAARESSFIRLARRDAPEVKGFDTLLLSGKPRCGQVRDSQREWLFGTGAVEIGSVALAPLGPEGRYGLLACGSSDSQRFNPAISTDFLARIAELVTAALAAE
ncbi:MAG: DUF484 family protein [Steroidobacteraceae bacterium]